MPGPRNDKKKRKQQAEKAKSKTKSKKVVLADAQPGQNIESNTSSILTVETQDNEAFPAPRHIQGECTDDTATSERYRQEKKDVPIRIIADESRQVSPTCPTVTWNSEPFVTDPGNGPRVKDMRAYLASFFCPPVTYSHQECAAFGREEVLGLLEAVLPHEVALVSYSQRVDNLK